MATRAFSLCFLALLLMFSCGDSGGSHNYTGVEEEVLWEDSISVRALELMPGALAFAGSDGVFGTIGLRDQVVRTGKQEHEGILPEFRAVAHTSDDFFMLSAGDPALLYKTGDSGAMELVYFESGPGVFYDSMAFWDDSNGIAFGDAIDGCFSLLITRDGGASWQKQACDQLPPAEPGEGAFAASDTNIVLRGPKCWIVTTRGRILYSPDKGRSWELIPTPLNPKQETRGMYSMDFWDETTGYAIGGDYTAPEWNQRNKMRTLNGGRQWELISEGAPPGYKSCVQYIPGAAGEDLVAVGFTGISYSADGGLTWQEFSESPYYSLRFANDSVAYASGKGRISRLVFRK